MGLLNDVLAQNKNLQDENNALKSLLMNRLRRLEFEVSTMATFLDGWSRTKVKRSPSGDLMMHQLTFLKKKDDEANGRIDEKEVIENGTL